MIYPYSIRKLNDFLASKFGYTSGRPRFQWQWGEDLTEIADVTDEDGNPVYDYHCACGINKVIHTHPNCNFTAPVPRKEKMCIVPRYNNRWVMSVYVGPRSCYYPVGDPEKTLACNEDHRPDMDDTILVMAAVTEHYSKSAVQRTAELRDQQAQMDRVSMDPDQMGDRQKAIYQRLKDQAPVGLKDEYGKTTQWHGQTGVGESPNSNPAKKLVTLD